MWSCACGGPLYCGKDCQTQHWSKSHSSECAKRKPSQKPIEGSAMDSMKCDFKRHRRPVPERHEFHVLTNGKRFNKGTALRRVSSGDDSQFQIGICISYSPGNTKSATAGEMSKLVMDTNRFFAPVKYEYKRDKTQGVMLEFIPCFGSDDIFSITGKPIMTITLSLNPGDALSRYTFNTSGPLVLSSGTTNVEAESWRESPSSPFVVIGLNRSIDTNQTNSKYGSYDEGTDSYDETINFSLYNLSVFFPTQAQK